MAGTGDTLTVATVERYKITARSCDRRWVRETERDRERERDSLPDYTVTSSKIRSLAAEH